MGDEGSLKSVPAPPSLPGVPAGYMLGSWGPLSCLGLSSPQQLLRSGRLNTRDLGYSRSYSVAKPSPKCGVVAPKSPKSEYLLVAASVN